MTQRDKIIPGPNVVKPIKGLILPRNVAEKYIKEKKSKHWSQIKDGPVKQTLTQKEYHADKKWREQEAKTAEIKKAIEYEKLKNLPEGFDVSKPALNKMPTPTGWRILVLPFQPKKKKKNIHLPDEFVERERLATVCAYVLKVGPDAYKDKEKFPNGSYCKEGDWILFGRYAGARFKIEGGEVRILNDDEIIATIGNPEDILHV